LRQIRSLQQKEDMIPNGILEGVFVLGFAMSCFTYEEPGLQNARLFTSFLNRLPFYIFANKGGRVTLR